MWPIKESFTISISTIIFIKCEYLYSIYIYSDRIVHFVLYYHQTRKYFQKTEQAQRRDRGSGNGCTSIF